MAFAADRISALARRGLIGRAAATAALALLAPPAHRHALAQPRFAANPFTLGVASGDPLPDGVVLWTRLAPEPLNGGGMSPAPVRVRWEVAADERFATIVAAGDIEARVADAHSIRVVVNGLSPGRFYWYRFMAGGAESPVGRTRTSPAAAAIPARVRIAVAGCQRYEQGYFTAYRHMAGEELDAVFHYGDYIYEYANRPGNAGQVRPVQGGETRTLDEYRTRHAQYRMDADLAAAHAAHPFIVTFDDHELVNDWAGGAPGEGAVREAFLIRKAMALQAWYEAMPLRPAQRPAGGAITAYRRVAFGRLATLHALDTRGFRDAQPCGNGLRRGCAERLSPARTMLGAAQEAWLAAGLGDGARWSVLGQQVTMMQRHLGEGPPFAQSMDAWDGYAAARGRLLAQVEAAGVDNLVVLTGDVHAAWVGELHRDADDPASPRVGTEFVATSIASGRDGSETTEAARTALRNNRHIRFHNNRRGYAVHDFTPARMAVSLRAVDQVSTPGASLTTKARFIVESGTARIAQA